MAPFPKHTRVWPDILCKAKEFALLLDVRRFEASNGWLTRFRDRHGIAWKTICGESKDADHEAARIWRDEKLRDIISGYSPDDIYNADETGQILPIKFFQSDSSKIRFFQARQWHSKMTVAKAGSNRKQGLLCCCAATPVAATSSSP